MLRATTGSTGGRPMIMAPHAVVSAGHYLATEIGLRMLQRGGNAIDAAAAAGFALQVLKPHQNGVGGEVPMLIYLARDRKVRALSGHGVAPMAATIEYFRGLGIQIIPGDGLLGAIVPPAPASWIHALEQFGTMRLAEVLGPAISLARDGFAMYDALHATIAAQSERFFTEWPTSAAVFLPGGQVPEVGTLFRQPQWAATLQRLLDAEGRHADRRTGLAAARAEFYEGAIAHTICRFCQENAFLDASGQAHCGLLTLEDFRRYTPAIEEPATSTYRDLAVYKCGPWTQGPVLLQTLNLLEGFDLRAMGHNSADYIHTVTEALKLAFADREFYYGDPNFTDVPMGRLLSQEYAQGRRGLIDPARASLELRPGDRPAVSAASLLELYRPVAGAPAASHGDTTKLEVIDAEGNMVSATPSGGWLQSSPVVEGLGFPLGTRGQMFGLDPRHPNCLAPGKRPRTTLTPSLATHDGRGYLAFGSPGGDVQDQWALQFLLNVVEFGMSLQQAVEAPTFWTAHAPNSFYPRTAEPGSLYVEGRIAAEVREELARRGHKITVNGDFSGGNTLAAAIDPGTGLRHAAASPRLDPAYAGGY